MTQTLESSGKPQKAHLGVYSFDEHEAQYFIKANRQGLLQPNRLLLKALKTAGREEEKSKLPIGLLSDVTRWFLGHRDVLITHVEGK